MASSGDLPAANTQAPKGEFDSLVAILRAHKQAKEAQATGGTSQAPVRESISTSRSRRASPHTHSAEHASAPDSVSRTNLASASSSFQQGGQYDASFQAAASFSKPTPIVSRQTVPIRDSRQESEPFFVSHDAYDQRRRPERQHQRPNEREECPNTRNERSVKQGERLHKVRRSTDKEEEADEEEQDGEDKQNKDRQNKGEQNKEKNKQQGSSLSVAALDGLARASLALRKSVDFVTSDEAVDVFVQLKRAFSFAIVWPLATALEILASCIGALFNLVFGNKVFIVKVLCLVFALSFISGMAQLGSELPMMLARGGYDLVAVSTCDNVQRVPVVGPMFKAACNHVLRSDGGYGQQPAPTQLPRPGTTKTRGLTDHLPTPIEEIEPPIPHLEALASIASFHSSGISTVAAQGWQSISGTPLQLPDLLSAVEISRLQGISVGYVTAWHALLGADRVAVKNLLGDLEKRPAADHVRDPPSSPYHLISFWLGRVWYVWCRGQPERAVKERSRRLIRLVDGAIRSRSILLDRDVTAAQQALVDILRPIKSYSRTTRLEVERLQADLRDMEQGGSHREKGENMDASYRGELSLKEILAEINGLATSARSTTNIIRDASKHVDQVRKAIEEDIRRLQRLRNSALYIADSLAGRQEPMTRVEEVTEAEGEIGCLARQVLRQEK